MHETSLKKIKINTYTEDVLQKSLFFFLNIYIYKSKCLYFVIFTVVIE